MFNLLAPEYVQDQAGEALKDLEREIDNEYETRYVLIDGKTGQLESRTLYEEYEEAFKASKEERHGESCLVATLLVEV